MKGKRGMLWWDETGKWIIGIAVLVFAVIFIFFVLLPALGVRIDKLFNLG